MLNVVVLMGRLTADPELRSSSSGVSYCRFTVAVDRGYTKPGEEKKADFINCVAWRQTAEFVSRYFSKGSMIAVQGSIQTGSYTNRDGVKVYTTDINVDNVSFTGSKRETSGDSGSSYSGNSYGGNSYQEPQQRAQSAPEPTYSSGSARDFAQTPLDDDLPF